MDPKDAPTDDPTLDRARRRLLRAAVYVAPAVVGAFATNRAEAQLSCGPAACNPNGGACGPNSCGPRG